MEGELTAKDVLQILGEMCTEHKGCENCPIGEEFGDFCDHKTFGENFEKVIEICKKWKANHAEIETEWAYICRIMEHAGCKKRCVYEEEVLENNIPPFDTYNSVAEKVLREYCKNHSGDFFLTLEFVCRKAEK